MCLDNFPQLRLDLSQWFRPRFRPFQPPKGRTHRVELERDVVLTTFDVWVDPGLRRRSRRAGDPRRDSRVYPLGPPRGDSLPPCRRPLVPGPWVEGGSLGARRGPWGSNQADRRPRATHRTSTPAGGPRALRGSRCRTPRRPGVRATPLRSGRRRRGRSGPGQEEDPRAVIPATCDGRRDVSESGV